MRPTGPKAHRRVVLRTGLTAGLTAGLAALSPRSARALPTLRLGTVQSGTVQWIAAVIRLHRLDQAQGFTLSPQVMATTESAKVALLSRSVDVSVSDWPFVALQRTRGSHLCFAPLSASLGGVMVPKGSPVHGLGDLAGRRLGVAGGPDDKSWLLVQAAARRVGADLSRARLAFGAPPLLGAKLIEGELDALLTFWNFCARLQARGAVEAVSVDSCARQLGLAEPPVLVGWVFDEAWARQNRGLIDGFLASVRAATEILRNDPQAWIAVRPLMAADSDAVADALRQRFLAGLRSPPAAVQSEEAAALIRIAVRVGGPGAMEGVTTLPPGTFW